MGRKALLILMIVLVVSGLMMTSCSDNREKSGKAVATHNENGGTMAGGEGFFGVEPQPFPEIADGLSLGYGLFRNNELVFEHDLDAKLTMDDLYRVRSSSTALTSLNQEYPIFAVRQNNGILYTIYSLKDKKLAYVLIRYIPNTSISFYIGDIIEYPFVDAESKQELSFLLDKDRPEVILGTKR